MLGREWKGESFRQRPHRRLCASPFPLRSLRETPFLCPAGGSRRLGRWAGGSIPTPGPSREREGRYGAARGCAFPFAASRLRVRQGGWTPACAGVTGGWGGGECPSTIPSTPACGGAGRLWTGSPLSGTEQRRVPLHHAVHGPPPRSGEDYFASSGARYCPVKLRGSLTTCSGVPTATISPPRTPPSGPRSMIQSAVLITSRLCSITTTPDQVRGRPSVVVMQAFAPGGTGAGRGTVP